jgi:hypothetical protein
MYGWVGVERRARRRPSRSRGFGSGWKFRSVIRVRADIERVGWCFGAGGRRVGWDGDGRGATVAAATAATAAAVVGGGCANGMADDGVAAAAAAAAAAAVDGGGCACGMADDGSAAAPAAVVSAGAGGCAGGVADDWGAAVC